MTASQVAVNTARLPFDPQEVAYVTAGSLIEQFRGYCEDHHVPFTRHETVRPYDDTTLFCPAGMQQFKGDYKDPTRTGTLANVQACLRLNDLDEIGDGTHRLHFDMLGLFSFRTMTVPEAIAFWFGFLDRIGVRVETVTIHPDRMADWAAFYDGRGVTIRPDPECVWSDGEIGGYCTEFYVGDVEIGNIVNTNGDSIDVGFGLERLLLVQGLAPAMARRDVLRETIQVLLDSGYRPAATRQGYVLRKLLRLFVREGGDFDHPVVRQERDRQERLRVKYERLKTRHADKPAAWWLGTHGIDLRDFAD